MCDYCDCRTRPPLDRLGHDHEQIAAVAQRIRHGIGSGDDQAVAHGVRELRTLLDAHDRAEEGGLYPELERAGVPMVGMRSDHDAVDAVLRSPVHDAREVLAALDALEEHIRREEYDLFPAAHQLVDDAGWDRIEHAATQG